MVIAVFKFTDVKTIVMVLIAASTAVLAQDGKFQKKIMNESVIKTEEEWRGCLTPEEYRILREKGTEMAFTGKYNRHSEEGIYTCAACGQELFSSDTKYDSGSGWPSFWQPISKEKVASENDKSFFMERTEILCSRCGGHIGHVFNDGPKPTGLRYCVNSTSLDFESRKDETVSKREKDFK